MTTTTIHLTLKRTTAQVVETSITNNSLSEDYSHYPDITLDKQLILKLFTIDNIDDKKHHHMLSFYLTLKTCIFRRLQQASSVDDQGQDKDVSFKNDVEEVCSSFVSLL